MTDYDVTLTPIKRASFDAGRKIKFWDNVGGTVAAVVKDHSGNVLTQPIKVPADGHLQVRFDQWPLWYSDNAWGWRRIKKVPGMPATLTVALDALTSSAAELNILDGATISKDDLNLTALIDDLVDFTIASAASTVATINVDLHGADGATVPGPRIVEVWLSDSAAGIGLTGTDASGTVTTKSGEGTVHETLTAKKHLRVQTKANGQFMIQITDTAKTGFYVAVLEPTTGVVSVSTQLVSGSYGA